MDISAMSLVGSGAQADVYRYEDKVYKVYKRDYRHTGAGLEARLQKKAYQAGLPVPAVYEVTELDGRSAVVMEYISGRPFGAFMQSDIGQAADYLDLAAALHIRMHSITASGFPAYSEKVKRQIIKTLYLNGEQKSVLLMQLKKLDCGECLCHGDYHVLNLIQTSDEDVRIIDWADAGCGSREADVCRSYLLYLLYRQEWAKIYLDAYCNHANLDQEKVLRWLPVLAGARFSENLREGDADILMDLVNADM